MKRIFLLLIFVLNLPKALSANQADQTNNTNTRPICQTHEDNTPVTLGRIAAIVSFFSNVIANPNDHKNVATSILGIISTIFTIAADTRKVDFNYLEFHQEIVNILQTGNRAEIEELQAIIKNTCDLQIKALQTYIKN